MVTALYSMWWDIKKNIKKILSLRNFWCTCGCKVSTPKAFSEQWLTEESA